MFSSIDDVITQFKTNNYIASRRIATVIYLAKELGKPILVEGPAGVGKTDLAFKAAQEAGYFSSGFRSFGLGLGFSQRGGPGFRDFVRFRRSSSWSRRR